MSSPGDPNGPGHIVLEAPELDAYDIIKVDEQLGALSKIRFPYNGICRVIGIAPVNLPQYVRQNGTQGEQCADALQALLDALRAQGVTDSAPLMHRTLKAEADAMHLTSSISDLQFRADRRLRELTESEQRARQLQAELTLALQENQRLKEQLERARKPNAQEPLSHEEHRRVYGEHEFAIRARSNPAFDLSPGTASEHAAPTRAQHLHSQAHNAQRSAPPMHLPAGTAAEHSHLQYQAAPAVPQRPLIAGSITPAVIAEQRKLLREDVQPFSMQIPWATWKGQFLDAVQQCSALPDEEFGRALRKKLQGKALERCSSHPAYTQTTVHYTDLLVALDHLFEPDTSGLGRALAAIQLHTTPVDEALTQVQKLYHEHRCPLPSGQAEIDGLLARSNIFHPSIVDKLQQRLQLEQQRKARPGVDNEQHIWNFPMLLSVARTLQHNLVADASWLSKVAPTWQQHEQAQRPPTTQQSWAPAPPLLPPSAPPLPQHMQQAPQQYAPAPMQQQYTHPPAHQQQQQQYAPAPTQQQYMHPAAPLQQQQQQQQQYTPAPMQQQYTHPAAPQQQQAPQQRGSFTPRGGGRHGGSFSGRGGRGGGHGGRGYSNHQAEPPFPSVPTQRPETPRSHAAAAQPEFNTPADTPAHPFIGMAMPSIADPLAASINSSLFAAPGAFTTRYGQALEEALQDSMLFEDGHQRAAQQGNGASSRSVSFAAHPAQSAAARPAQQQESQAQASAPTEPAPAPAAPAAAAEPQQPQPASIPAQQQQQQAPTQSVPPSRAQAAASAAPPQQQQQSAPFSPAASQAQAPQQHPRSADTPPAAAPQAAQQASAQSSPAAPTQQQRRQQKKPRNRRYSGRQHPGRQSAAAGTTVAAAEPRQQRQGRGRQSPRQQQQRRQGPPAPTTRRPTRAEPFLAAVDEEPAQQQPAAGTPSPQPPAFELPSSALAASQEGSSTQELLLRICSRLKGPISAADLAELCADREAVSKLAQLTAAAGEQPKRPSTFAAAVAAPGPSAAASRPAAQAAGSAPLTKASAVSTTGGIVICSASGAAAAPAHVTLSKNMGSMPAIKAGLLQGHPPYKEPETKLHLDCGAGVSCVREGALEKFMPALAAKGARRVRLLAPVSISVVGDKTTFAHEALVGAYFQVGKLMLRFDMLIVPHMPVDFLIGMDYIPVHNMVADWRNNLLHMDVHPDLLAPGAKLQYKNGMPVYSQAVNMYVKYSTLSLPYSKP